MISLVIRSLFKIVDIIHIVVPYNTHNVLFSVTFYRKVIVIFFTEQLVIKIQTRVIVGLWMAMSSDFCMTNAKKKQ